MLVVEVYSDLWPLPQCVQVRVNLWDLAGSDEYIEVRNEFYKEAQGCLLVYDVTSRSSFESLGRWLAESKAHGADNMVRLHRNGVIRLRKNRT